MSKDRKITTTKKPDRVCPHCGSAVSKFIFGGQLSYSCEGYKLNKNSGVTGCHWGPWDDAIPIEKALKERLNEVMEDLPVPPEPDDAEDIIEGLSKKLKTAQEFLRRGMRLGARVPLANHCEDDGCEVCEWQLEFNCWYMEVDNFLPPPGKG